MSRLLLQNEVEFRTDEWLVKIVQLARGETLKFSSSRICMQGNARAADGGVGGARLSEGNGRLVLKEGWASAGGQRAEAAAVHAVAGPGVAAKTKDRDERRGNLHPISTHRMTQICDVLMPHNHKSSDAGL
jgi:hypothetical protein